MKCALSNSGLLSAEDGRDFLLSDVVRNYNSSSEGKVVYDKANGVLTIKDDYRSFEIFLNASQKKQFEGRTDDPNIESLQQISLSYERGRLLEQVKDGIEDGVYPKDRKAISIYNSSLNVDLLTTGAKVVGSSILALWPFLLVGATIPIWTHPSPFGFASWTESQQFLFTLGLMIVDGIGVGAALFRMIFRVAGDSSPTYEMALDSMKEFVGTILKKHRLKKYVKALDKEIRKESFTDFVHREDEKDDAKARKNKDRFFNEFNDILVKYEKLPPDRKDVYRTPLANLLTEYQNRVNALLDGNTGKHVLGEAQDIWQVFVQLLPKLEDLNSSISEEVKDLNEKERFNSEVNNYRQILATGGMDATLGGSSSSVTEELTDSGVAYQRMG